MLDAFVAIGGLDVAINALDVAVNELDELIFLDHDFDAYTSHADSIIRTAVEMHLNIAADVLL